MTYAFAVNASPKKDKSHTSLILAPFLEGMEEAGAEVELFYTRDLKIQPCTGEFNCWVKHPGECYQQDDMQQLYPKLETADILVLATPVYVDGVAGPLKNFIDRMIPLVKPMFELRDGHCRHPPREGVNRGQLAFVANCGFWELDNFDPLVAHMKALCRNMSRRFAGALLRPHGPALFHLQRSGSSADDVVAAAREAGRQLVREGQIADEVLLTVSRELLPLDVYVEEINKGFSQALESRSK